MKQKIIIRIIADIIMLGLIAWAPWWLILVALVVAFLYFATYYEAIIFGIMIDSLYGTRDSASMYALIGSIRYTVLCTILFFIMPPVRRRIRSRFHSDSL